MIYNTFHIIPTNENHQDSINCKCNPTIERINNHIIITHNSIEDDPNDVSELTDPENFIWN